MTTLRQVCTRAFGELQYFPEGEGPSAGAMADAVAAFNSLVASWHTRAMLFYWPSGKTWRKAWATNTGYAVNDLVSRSGSLYVCTTAHTSSVNDRPGVSAGWEAFWDVYREPALTLDDDIIFPPEFERGIIAMLAVEIAPMMGVNPSPFTMRKASEGETALLAAYMQIEPVAVDAGITRMPSQIWPYSIDQNS